MYIHYGCGLTAPKEWNNFDVSPTLRLQKIPLIGSLISPMLNVRFPRNVHYGDIIKGLPLADNSCDGVFCSHVLEHLSLMDLRKALKNTYLLLKPEGIFRCVVPDLEYATRVYIDSLKKGDQMASIRFIKNTLLGVEQRPRGLKALLSNVMGNSNHLWMWDRLSLAHELSEVGFREIRECKFNDCNDEKFQLVENKNRFINAVALECKK